MNKPMTPEEIAELENFIHEHLFDDGKVGLMKRGLWWRPDGKGYTSKEEEAGRYTIEEAKRREYLHGDQPVTIVQFTRQKYARDMAQVGPVLDKCIHCAEVVIGSDGDRIEMQDFQGLESGFGFGVEAAELPLAVCLFARKMIKERMKIQTRNDK